MTDYEVRTAAGRVMFTTPHREKAIRYARMNAPQFPGLYVETVERIEHRRRIWTNRKEMAA